MFSEKEYIAINNIRKLQDRKFDIRFDVSFKDIKRWEESLDFGEPINYDFDSITSKIIESFGDITYSDELIEKLRSIYKFLPKQIYKQEKYSGVEIYVIMPKESCSCLSIIETMKQNGYFMSYKYSNGSLINFVFEPYIALDATKDIRMLKTLYHYTSNENVNDIMKNGLKPMSKNKIFSYPDRVYLMLEEDHNLVEKLKKVSNSEVKYVELMIDIDSLQENINFYYDCMKKNAVYTDEIIPSKCIKVNENISI